MFHALSDPTRRAVVERLRDAPQSVSALAAAHPISLAAFVKHLAVLENGRAHHLDQDRSDTLVHARRRRPPARDAMASRLRRPLEHQPRRARSRTWRRTHDRTHRDTDTPRRPPARLASVDRRIRVRRLVLADPVRHRRRSGCPRRRPLAPRVAVAGIGVSGEFAAVEPHARLVFTWRWDADETETLVTVTFADSGDGGTILTSSTSDSIRRGRGRVAPAGLERLPRPACGALALALAPDATKGARSGFPGIRRPLLAPFVGAPGSARQGSGGPARSLRLAA